MNDDLIFSIDQIVQFFKQPSCTFSEHPIEGFTLSCDYMPCGSCVLSSMTLINETCLTRLEKTMAAMDTTYEELFALIHSTHPELSL